MQFEQSAFKLVRKGCNSDVYRYGGKERGVVIKMVNHESRKQCKHLANEYAVMSGLNHENILKVHKHKQKLMIKGMSSTSEIDGCKDVLVMENAVHGSLLDWNQLAKPTLSQKRWILSELCEAIRYLHCNYIVHRDLKLDNVLVTEDKHKIVIKVADFGFASKVQESPLSKEHKGTRKGFMAPEIHEILNNSTVLYDTYKSDIFALGVILFCLVFDRLPFQHATRENQLYSLIANKNESEFWKAHQTVLQKNSQEKDFLMEDFKQIFISMVQYNPAERPNIEQILDCSWLKGTQHIVTIA